MYMYMYIYGIESFSFSGSTPILCASAITRVDEAALHALFRKVCRWIYLPHAGCEAQRWSWRHMHRRPSDSGCRNPSDIRTLDSCHMHALLDTHTPLYLQSLLIVDPPTHQSYFQWSYDTARNVIWYWLIFAGNTESRLWIFFADRSLKQSQISKYCHPENHMKPL